MQISQRGFKITFLSSHQQKISSRQIETSARAEREEESKRDSDSICQQMCIQTNVKRSLAHTLSLPVQLYHKDRTRCRIDSRAPTHTELILTKKVQKKLNLSVSSQNWWKVVSIFRDCIENITYFLYTFQIQNNPECSRKRDSEGKCVIKSPFEVHDVNAQRSTWNISAACHIGLWFLSCPRILLTLLNVNSIYVVVLMFEKKTIHFKYSSSFLKETLNYTHTQVVRRG